MADRNMIIYGNVFDKEKTPHNLALILMKL